MSVTDQKFLLQTFCAETANSEESPQKCSASCVCKFCVFPHNIQCTNNIYGCWKQRLIVGINFAFILKCKMNVACALHKKTAVHTKWPQTLSKMHIDSPYNNFMRCWVHCIQTGLLICKCARQGHQSQEFAHCMKGQQCTPYGQKLHPKCTLILPIMVLWDPECSPFMQDWPETKVLHNRLSCLHKQTQTHNREIT